MLVLLDSTATHYLALDFLPDDDTLDSIATLLKGAGAVRPYTLTVIEDGTTEPD